MHMSSDGLKLLMSSEGFRSQVYLDVAGLETVGFGHRVLPGESFPHGVTEEDAQIMLEDDVTLAEGVVAHLVYVPLTQGQFDALVDFVFNLGAARLADSTLLRELNKGHYDRAASEILRWDHAGGRELPALKARRQREVALWNAGSSCARPSAA